MKLKPTVILATFVVTMGLLLGANAAQAATVNFDPNDSSRAIGITDLDIGGTIYNVDFVGPTEAINVYGELPGDFEFTTIDSAVAAVDAVNAALNAAGGVKYVGPEGGENNPFAEVYDVGWSTDTVIGVPFANNVESFVGSGGTWAKRSSPDQSVYGADSRTWATFTAVEGVAPGIATLISPSGTIAEDTPTYNTPTYIWNAVESSTWYLLQVDDSEGEKAVFQWFEADATGCGDGTGECSVTPATELADGAARWSIQTWNEFGFGPWSDPLEFTVDSVKNVALGQATLISPSGTITENTPKYTWNAVENSTYYYLGVQDLDGNQKKKWYTADEAGCGSGTGECSVTPEFLLADDSYNWWIQTWNDAGTGPWSAPLSFTVSGGREAEVIFDPNDSSRAIGITNLNIDGTLANVEFTPIVSASKVYGPLPGDFQFTTSATAAAAVDAVNAALNAAGGVDFVGAEGGADNPLNKAFDVGWSSEGTGALAITNIIESTVVSGTWERRDPDPPDVSVYNADSRTWATFTVAE